MEEDVDADDCLLALLQEAGILISESADPSNTHWPGPSSVQPGWAQEPGYHSFVDEELIQLPNEVQGGLLNDQRGHSKPKRRRNTISSSVLVKELEQRLQQLTISYQEQKWQQLLASTRVDVLQMVLAVKEEQVARVKQLRQGLSFNPLEALGMTPQDLESCTPSFVMSKFTAITNRLAQRLALVMQQPGIKATLADVMRQGVHATSSAPNPATSPALPPAQGAVNHEVGLLMADISAMQTSFKYVFFMKPQLLLASSMHVDSLQLMGDLEARGAPAGPILSAAAMPPDQGDTPELAPESHWRDLVTQLHLSDHQKLQAAVLCEIISKARMRILQQRTTLVRSISKALQPPTGKQPQPASSNDRHHQELVGTVWRDADQLQHEAKLIDTLDKTLIKERALVLLAAEVLYNKVLTPTQCAMVLVASYPFVPDDLAILHAASTEFDVGQKTVVESTGGTS